MTSKEQLISTCETIASELTQGVKVTEDNLEYFENNDLKIGDSISANDYLEYLGYLNMTYTVSEDLSFRNGRIAVCLGGPNIFINTDGNMVEGYWGADKVSIYFTDKIGIDDYLENMYNSMRYN